MPTDIVLPNLPNWFQQHINTLYSAKTAQEFDDAFDAFIAQEVSIKVNGKATSRDEYKQMVQGQITGDVGAQVTFNGVVSVPSEDKDLRAIGVRSLGFVLSIVDTDADVALQTGTVGAFFSAEVFGKFFIFGARQANTVNSSMNVVYVLTASYLCPSVLD